MTNQTHTTNAAARVEGNFIPLDAERQPVVFAKEGEIFANSRDVASFFGKNHFDVLKAIRNLIATEPDLGVRNFASFKINDLTGEATSHYEMDRDGFTLLAMGFTGTKALKFKLQYIQAYKALEAEVKRLSDSPQTINLNDASALRGLLLTYSEKTLVLEQRVQELEPSERALDRISKADGSTCITDTAKMLQMRPKDLFSYLRQNGWIYRRPTSGTDLGYQSKIISGLLEHKVTVVTRADGSERETTQVRVTAKGLTNLAKIIKPIAREVQ